MKYTKSQRAWLTRKIICAKKTLKTNKQTKISNQTQKPKQKIKQFNTSVYFLLQNQFKMLVFSETYAVWQLSLHIT